MYHCWSWLGTGNQFICRPEGFLFFERGGRHLFSPSENPAQLQLQHEESKARIRIPQGDCGLLSPLFLPKREVFTSRFVACKPLPASALPIGLVKSRVWPDCFCLHPTLRCWCRWQNAIPKPRPCLPHFCALPLGVCCTFGQRNMAHGLDGGLFNSCP